MPNVKFDAKKVWGYEMNTDRTEGRGRQYTAEFFESESDAIKASAKKGVMGTNAPVVEINLIRSLKITGSPCWYGPVVVNPASRESTLEDRRLENIRLIKEKAKKAGLTPEEIKLLASS